MLTSIFFFFFFFFFKQKTAYEIVPCDWSSDVCSSDLLISLAAPVFELVLKLRSGALAASSTLRATVHQMLQEMEERGATLRHSERQINSVKFALAAFVDETVLTTHSPVSAEWEKFPLQLE